MDRSKVKRYKKAVSIFLFNINKCKEKIEKQGKLLKLHIQVDWIQDITEEMLEYDFQNSNIYYGHEKIIDEKNLYYRIRESITNIKAILSIHLKIETGRQEARKLVGKFENSIEKIYK